jgi:hypothetical protein
MCRLLLTLGHVRLQLLRKRMHLDEGLGLLNAESAAFAHTPA